MTLQPTETSGQGKAMDVFNKLRGKFDATSDNRIWKCLRKLSLSLFLSFQVGGVLVSLSSALGTNKSNVVYNPGVEFL